MGSRCVSLFTGPRHGARHVPGEPAARLRDRHVAHAQSGGQLFYNKWARSRSPDDDVHHGPGFAFPIFYTMWNMVASFLGANLLMIGVPSSRTLSWAQFWRHKYSLLLLSCVSVLNITLQNASLVQIGLSVNQMIK